MSDLNSELRTHDYHIFKMPFALHVKTSTLWWTVTDAVLRLSNFMSYTSKLSHKYISGDWPLSIHADHTSTRRTILHKRRISSSSIYSSVRMQADSPAALMSLSLGLQARLGSFQF